MKRLLLLLFLWPLLLPAANPPYEAFLGTNGIIVRSNPPLGKILIDGTNFLYGQVWTNDNGTLKPVAFPTNILLRVNTPDDATGTNFYFDSRIFRTNAASKLFAVYNGGSNALTIGPYGGIFQGRANSTPFPGAVIYGIFDTAIGETNQQELFIQSKNSAVGFYGAADLLVDTNYSALILTANKEGGVKFSRFAIQAGSGLNPEDFNTFTMQALVDGTSYMQMDPNFTLLTPTNYLFSSSVRITNIHTLMSLQNSNTPVFEVDGVGDLRLLKRVPYMWPSAQGAAFTALRNEGDGTLKWETNFSTINVTNLTVNNNFIVNGRNLTGLQTNQYTTNVSLTPVLGTLWFNGTNFPEYANGANTNGARVALEYVPFKRSLRMGQLSTGTGNDYWDTTNLGICSVAFGSNNLAGGQASAVLGGTGNLIPTNTPYSVIVGGEANTMQGSAGGRNFIGGGDNNTIGVTTSNSVIVGGDTHIIDASIHYATIGGGQQNRVRQLYGTVSGGVGNDARGTFGTIGGGANNIAGTASGDDHTTIAGGELNQIDQPYGFIGGGLANRVNTSGTGAAIAGGLGNNLDGPYSFAGSGFGNRTENLADYSVIGGGYTNYISTASSAIYAFIMGGVSNRVTSAPLAGVIGNFATNATPRSVLVAPFGPLGSNQLHVTATATTNLGPLKVSAGNAFVASYASVGGTISVNATPVASAGAAETNLITYSIPAHTLTNANDRLLVRASGRFAGNANAKQIKLILGSETILDTTSQVANSGAWLIEAEIIRTGNTAQSVNASYHGTAESLFTTASSLDLAQTNGIATTLKITSTAAGDGDVTNRTLTVEWRATP